MPTTMSTAPANATSRRTFLTRTAIGSAVAAAGVIAAPSLGLLPAGIAGADTLEDGDFALFAAPLELAAVQIYQAALTSSNIPEDSETFALLQGISSNHEAVAKALSGLVPEGSPAPVAAPGLVDQLAPTAAKAPGDALLKAMAGLEDQLSATHLSAIGSLVDPVTAKLVAQVVASEAQTAAALGLLAGGSVASLTPARADTKDAIAAGDLDGAPPATTTTTAAN